jgi:hypothetical protein
MKKIIISATLFLLTGGTFAQSNKEDVDIIQSIFGKQKKEVISAYMTIPQKKVDQFWKLYDTYENARKTLGRQRISLIEQYAKHYDNLTDAKAGELATKKLAWNASYAKFQQTYFTKFSAVIGGLQAAKFIQLEDYIENCIRVAISDEIPFIDQLEKTKQK